MITIAVKKQGQNKKGRRTKRRRRSKEPEACVEVTGASNSEEVAAGEDGGGHLEGGPGALKARMKAVRRLSWLDSGPGKKA